VSPTGLVRRAVAPARVPPSLTSAATHDSTADPLLAKSGYSSVASRLVV